MPTNIYAADSLQKENILERYIINPLSNLFLPLFLPADSQTATVYNVIIEKSETDTSVPKNPAPPAQTNGPLTVISSGMSKDEVFSYINSIFSTLPAPTSIQNISNTYVRGGGTEGVANSLGRTASALQTNIDNLSSTVGGILTTPSITGEASFGSSLLLSQISAPSDTSNRLYNTGGDLYWAGNLIGGGSVGNWTLSGSNAYRTSGNVGIGTSSPFAKLSVVGDGYFTSSLSSANLTATGTVTFSNSSLANAILTTNSLGQLISTTTLTINNVWATSTTATNYFAGNVGVGTVTTNYKLDVNGIISGNEIRFNPKKPQGLVTFVFDDGTLTDSMLMAPLFAAKGVPAVSAVITDNVDTGGYTTWAQIQALAAAGWEIASHTKTHPDLRTLTEEQLQTEFSASNAAIRAHGITVENLVYPSHFQNATVRRVARSYYRSARGNANQGINPEVLPTHQLVSLMADNPALLATYQEYVDRAATEGKWMIFYLHGTDAADITALGTLIDYIQTKPLSIVTMSQALDLVGNEIDVGDGFAAGESGIRLNLPATTDDQTGVIYKNWLPFIHTFQATGASGNNTFMGLNSGNFSMSPAGGASYLASYNSGFGEGTGYSLTTGERNSFFGASAGRLVSTGYDITAVGQRAGYGITVGSGSSYFGTGSGVGSTGSSETFIGASAGAAVITGSGNTCIGYGTCIDAAQKLNAVNSTAIGKDAFTTASNQVVVGNSSVTDVYLGSPTALARLRAVGGTFSGNVGIGTTSPYAILSVESTAGGTTPLFTVSSSTNGTGTSTALYISNNGNIGIGTTSPWTKLGVNGTVAMPGLVNDSTGYYVCLNTTTGQLATSTGVCGASSIKYKENVQSLSYGLEDVLKLKPVSFDYKNSYIKNAGGQIGFIAEEVDPIIPEVVSKDQNGEIQGLDYPKFTSVIVKAIQELNAKFDSFKNLVLDSLTSTTVYTREITADKINVNGDICVNNTCITKDQFEDMILKSGVGAVQTVGGSLPPPDQGGGVEGGGGEATSTPVIEEENVASTTPISRDTEENNSATSTDSTTE